MNEEREISQDSSLSSFAKKQGGKSTDWSRSLIDNSYAAANSNIGFDLKKGFHTGDEYGKKKSRVR